MNEWNLKQYLLGADSIYKSENLFEPNTNAICKQKGKKEKLQITITQ